MSAAEIVRRVLSAAVGNPLLERLLVASLELAAVTALVLVVIHVARVRSNRVVAIMWLVAMSKPIFGLAVGAPASVFNIGSFGMFEVPAAVATDAILTPRTAGALDLYRGGTYTAATAAVAAPTGRGWNGSTSAAPRRAVFGVWLAGAAFMALLSIADRLRVKRLVSAAARPSPAVTALYARAAAQEHCGRAPRLLISDRIESPAIAGTLRPVIFLPAWIAHDPHPERVVWALRHELTHWRHRDHLAGLIGEIARVVFFFHPLVWWIGRKWKVAAEIACDQALVGTRRDARHYAEQLYQILARVHTRRRIMLANGLFATRTQIGKRIEILLNSRPGTGHGRKLPGVVFLALFAVVVFSLGMEIAPAAKEKKIAIELDGEEPRTTLATITEDGRKLTVATKGDVVFNKAGTDIKSISAGGSFKLVENREGVEREIEVTPEEDGGLKWVYKVDGEVGLFDDDAREWFRECVEHVDILDGDDFLVVGDPHFEVHKPLVVKAIDAKPHVMLHFVEPSDRIAILTKDDVKTVVGLTVEEFDENRKVLITTSGKLATELDGGALCFIEKTGEIHVVIEKDGDRHELQITTGEEGREFVYKLNGQEKPYDEEAKTLFGKYLRELEDGFELRSPRGERI